MTQAYLPSTDGFAAPDLVTGFERIGMRLLGRRGVDGILSAPDQIAFVRVSWAWGSPTAVITSLLTDGRLIETQSAWRQGPAQGQLVSRSRGRAVQVVATQEPLALWKAHMAALRRLGEVHTIRHRDLAQYAELTDLMRAHTQDCAAAGRAAMGGLLAPALLLLVSVLALSTVTGASTPMIVSAVVVTALVILGGVRLLHVSSRWRRVLRPTFHAPAELAGFAPGHVSVT